MRLRVLPLPHSADPADTTSPFVLILDDVGRTNRDHVESLRADLDLACQFPGCRGSLVLSDRVELPDADPLP
jgi:hypothetical protein